MDGLFQSLNNKNVLVTGSSRGIGRALAEGFAQNGANVAVHGISCGEKIQNVIKCLSAYDGKITAVYGDLSDPNTAKRLIMDTVSALGGIDILVCNASIQIRKPWMEITDEEMLLQTQVNFFSTVKLIQNAVPYMLENDWGRIITIGSTQQQRPHPDMLIYSATKSAVRNSVISLALQLASKNITVNNVSVGTINTDRNTEVLKDKVYYEKVRNSNPVKFIGEPEDCVAAVMLLASESGRYITGDDIHIDGGKAVG